MASIINSASTNVSSSFFAESQEWIFFNSRLSSEKQNIIIRAIQGQSDIKNHFWLMSSGTESARRGTQKMIALSREAILAAAQGVVKTFVLTKDDIYLKSLPTFHIGGLSIYARAHVGGFSVIESHEGVAWNPAVFTQLLTEKNITVASLVPPQIFDLVERKVKAPTSLRWIFVGGGAISESLFERGRELGWPLVLTYGMTEASAMLAYAESPRSGAKKLPQIFDWRVEESGRLSFYGSSLLTAYLFADSLGQIEITDPKINGWYPSDDRGEIKDGLLFLHGRESEVVKINGETVSLLEVQNLWEQHLRSQKLSIPSVILALPDSRSGFSLALVVTKSISLQLVEDFNQQVLPFQRLQRSVQVASFPSNEMGKVLRHELAELIGKTHK